MKTLQKLILDFYKIFLHKKGASTDNDNYAYEKLKAENDTLRLECDKLLLKLKDKWENN
ncbi:hypothetical protein [Flavobacterium rhizosphaerae]|uniref:Phage protein n=1 Tax=Flavobacterium rhizosphaerae TaxID=3163298 RepID=A0ABW8Z0J1_9FLAO